MHWLIHDEWGGLVGALLLLAAAGLAGAGLAEVTERIRRRRERSGK